MGVAALDRFARPDGALGLAETGQAWTIQSGTWGIVSGKAKRTAGANGDQGTAVLDVGAAPNTGLVEMYANISTASSGADSGLVACGIDDANYILFQVALNASDNAALIFKRDGGSFTTLSTALGVGWAWNATHWVKAEVTPGGLCRVFRDGTQINSYQMTAGEITKYLGATKFGLRVNWNSGDPGASAHDDFTVRHPLLAKTAVY